MADETPIELTRSQLDKLVGMTKRDDRTRRDKLLDQLLGALVTAVVIGWLTDDIIVENAKV